MRSFKLALLAGAALFVAHAGVAQAAPSYAFTVTTGLTSGSGFSTLPTSTPFSGSPATASFTYSGDLNFVNTAAQNSPSANPGDTNANFFGANASGISNYSYVGGGPVVLGGTTVANFSTLSSFLNSSGSVANYLYGSLYTITLGALAAGTNLTITHDDGISLFKDGVQVAGGVSGPTNQVTDFFTLSGGNYTLYYSRQNGTPSVLQVAVPEPASMALFGAGLFGLGLIRRRKAATKA